MNLEELGNRLYELRKEHHYSQEELADKINVSRQAVSRWERGEVAPDTENLICLSKLYGISLDELVNGKVEKIPEEEIEIQDKPKPNEKKSIVVDIVSGLTVLITLICYLLISSLTGLWHPLWLMFLAIPIIITFVEAIQKKDMNHFAYPVLAVLAYLLLGFLWGIWHPSWVIFLTIPVYYFLCSFISQLIRKKGAVKKLN